MIGPSPFYRNGKLLGGPVEAHGYGGSGGPSKPWEHACRWLLCGDVGASSRCLVASYLGVGGVVRAYPLDASDRARCIGAIQAIPGLFDHLKLMEKTDGWDEQVPLIRGELERIIAE